MRGGDLSLAGHGAAEGLCFVSSIVWRLWNPCSVCKPDNLYPECKSQHESEYKSIKSDGRKRASTRPEVAEREKEDFGNLLRQVGHGLLLLVDGLCHFNQLEN